MKIYVTQGEHYSVPGRRMALHWTREAADNAAIDMLNIIRADLEDSYQVAMPAISHGEPWEEALRWAKALYEKNGDAERARTLLAENPGVEEILTEGTLDVWIEELDIAQPRVLVALEGGLVQGVVADIPIDAVVIDYDAKEASPDDEVYLIPQDGDRQAEAFRSEHYAAIDPAFITNALNGELSSLDLDDAEDRESRWYSANYVGNHDAAILVTATFADEDGDMERASLYVADAPDWATVAEKGFRFIYGDISNLDMSARPPVSGEASR